MSNFPEQRLKMLEDSAFKEKREIETRQNAEDLHRYLDFADIDWKNVKPSEFEVVNFSGRSTIKTTGGDEVSQAFDERLSRRFRNLNNFGTRGLAHSMRYEAHTQPMIHDNSRQY